jgi:hypothetical protein
MRKAYFSLVLFLAPVLLSAADTPFATREETEQYLRTAKITKAKTLGTGVTLPMKLTLDDGKVQHFGVFKSIDEHKTGITNLAASSEIDFKDSWMYEIAAYEIDKILGLNMVPVTVERTWDGKRGSLQVWVNNCMEEGERIKKKVQPPSPITWNQQMYKVRLFDNLIYNIDRNLGNLLITPDWRLYMIDHSRSFKNVAVVKSPKDLVSFSRSLMESLSKLDKDNVTAACSKYLSGAEIQNLLKRRDLLVEVYTHHRAEKGEAGVYP